MASTYTGYALTGALSILSIGSVLAGWLSGKKKKSTLSQNANIDITGGKKTR
jgi:hypothetical protein